MLKLDVLKRHVSYNPATGVFTRKLPSQVTFKHKAGTVMGSVDAYGYVIIGLLGRRYRANQLAWFYMTGTWAKLVDHKDTDKQNNAWPNLRAGTKSGNAANTGLRTTNTSGIKGVCFDKRNKHWIARIGGSPTLHLGYYKSKEDAAYVRGAISKIYYGEFSRE